MVFHTEVFDEILNVSVVDEIALCGNYLLKAKPIVAWNMVASYLQIYRGRMLYLSSAIGGNINTNVMISLLIVRQTSSVKSRFLRIKKRPSSGGPVARSYICFKIVQREVMFYKKDL